MPDPINKYIYYDHNNVTASIHIQLLWSIAINSRYRKIKWSAKPQFNSSATITVAKSNDVDSIINKADWSCVRLNDYCSVEPYCGYMCMSYLLHKNHELLCMILQYSMFGTVTPDMA